MYSGMADVAALTGNKDYLQAIDTIWKNVVNKKLYITGGIGASGHGEAFGKNYELPNMSAYCETCAAIANVFWNYRQFLLHGESKYYDILERTLYNGVISGINLEGDRFFYPNPLESVGQHSRSEWFGCACCPSNICRFMPSIPGYVYAKKGDELYVNLFVDSEANIEIEDNHVQLSQKTNYPWEGKIAISVNPKKAGKFKILVRIPGWVQNHPVPSNLYTYLNAQDTKCEIRINGKNVNYNINNNGYAELVSNWAKGDVIEVDFPMEVHRSIANKKVIDDHEKTAIERGPIVYCLEWTDNDGQVLNSVVEDGIQFTPKYEERLNGIVSLYADAKSAQIDTNGNVQVIGKKINAIPYYAWANRGNGEMAVWLPRTVNSTRPLPPLTISTKTKESKAYE